MRKTLLLCLFIGLVLSGFNLTYAQDQIAQTSNAVACADRNSYGDFGHVYARYEYRNKRLVLVDVDTRKVIREVEISLPGPQVQSLVWSPDCRYLSGAIGYYKHYTTVIWDITTNARVAEFERGDSYLSPSLWSPDSRDVIVNTDGGAFLLDTQTLQRTLLTDDYVYYPYWDYTRHQIIVHQGDGDIVAFDLGTGQVVGFFHDPDWYGYPEFVLSRDNTKIVVYSRLPGTFLAIWDRDTMVETRVNMGIYGASSVDISPNNRYLVVVNQTFFRIWDLENLPADIEARNPVTSVYHTSSWGIHFVDDDYVQQGTYRGQSRTWDIHTGQLVSSS